LSRAEEALNARDAAAATTWLRQALAHPRLAAGQHVEAELLLARAARLQEQPDAAMAAADRAEAAARAANDGAGVVAVLRERSALAVLAGRTDVAAADLAAWESLAEEADEPQLLFEARVASARFLLDRGNADRALERLSSLAAEARGVNLRSGYLAVAEVWLAKGDAARAAVAYSLALGFGPDAADALVGRAKARLQAGQADGARADWWGALVAGAVAAIGSAACPLCVRRCGGAMKRTTGCGGIVWLARRRRETRRRRPGCAHARSHSWVGVFFFCRLRYSRGRS
jgi:tetratricopeptide (TPR) repeat protein